MAKTYGIELESIVAAGWVGLYLDYFKEGLRIPVSPFLLEVIGYYTILKKKKNRL